MDPRTHPLHMSLGDVDNALAHLCKTYSQGFLTGEYYSWKADSLLDLRIVLTRNRLLYGSE